MHQKNKYSIGIITGSGPEAGIDLWRKLLSENKKQKGRQFSGDIDCPEVYIFSLPILGLSMDIQKNEKIIWETLKEGLLELDKLADIIIIACNTLHYYIPQIRELNISGHFISINDIIEEYLQKNNINDFAILGINTVSDFNNYFFPFKNLKCKYQIENLSQDVIQRLHNISINIKNDGVTNTNRNAMTDILEKVKSNTCLLACTEFPLLKISHTGKNIIDINFLLIQHTLSYGAKTLYQ